MSALTCLIDTKSRGSQIMSKNIYKASFYMQVTKNYYIIENK
jgi:hypothetical protein